MFFEQLKTLIISLLSQKYGIVNRIEEVIFIKGKIYTFQPGKLIQARDYVELLLFLNACPNMQIELLSRTARLEVHSQESTNLKINTEEHVTESPTKRRKILEVSKLEGNPVIVIDSKSYDVFVFEDGKCINSLSEIFYEELAEKFIKQNSLYKLQQAEYLTVHISHNNNNRN